MGTSASRAALLTKVTSFSPSSRENPPIRNKELKYRAMNMIAVTALLTWLVIPPRHPLSVALSEDTSHHQKRRSVKEKQAKGEE